MDSTTALRNMSPIRRVAAGPGYDITILRGTVPMLQKFTRSEPMIDGKKYPPSNTSRKPPANTLAFLPDIGVDAGVGDAFAIVTFSMLTFSALTGIARRTSGSFVAGASRLAKSTVASQPHVTP